MKKHFFRCFVLVVCCLVLMQLSTLVSAQDAATPSPAPTMDMSSKDNAEATPMVDMSMMDTGDKVIRFAARVGDKDFACGMTYDGLGADKSSVQVSDFRFYVSNIRLIDANKKEVSLELEQDSLWQYKNIALLDFEDGLAGCGEGGNDLLHTKVMGTVPPGTYTGLVFDVGVPFDLNHLDISTAPSPLNLDAMFWAWSVGYKFIRVDMLANGNPYFVHLGSTGCNAASDTEAPTAPCSNPNRMTVRFDTFDSQKNFVVADLAELVKGVTLSTSEPRPPGCMSGPDDSDCKTLFPNLGLGLDTGKLLETPQQFFRME